MAVSDNRLERLVKLLEDYLCTPARVSLEIGFVYSIATELLERRRSSLVDVRTELVEMDEEENAFRIAICDSIDRALEEAIPLPDGPDPRACATREKRWRAETPCRPLARPTFDESDDGPGPDESDDVKRPDDRRRVPRPSDRPSVARRWFWTEASADE